METVSFGRNLRQLDMALSDPEPDPEENQIESPAALKESAEGFFKDYNAPTDKKMMTAMVNLL